MAFEDKLTIVLILVMTLFVQLVLWLPRHIARLEARKEEELLARAEMALPEEPANLGGGLMSFQGLSVNHQARSVAAYLAKHPAVVVKAVWVEDGTLYLIQ